jgi:hypothetical protein
MSLRVRGHHRRFSFPLCSDSITPGGDLTGFIVDRDADKTETELLMTGNGQYGGLGNNTFSNGQSNPTRVKALSGLQQCK